jgi:hypothetical protein
LLNPLDRFVHGGVSGNPVEITQLEDAGAEGDQNRLIEAGGIAPGVETNQVIELRLKSQCPKNYVICEGYVPSR